MFSTTLITTLLTLSTFTTIHAQSSTGAGVAISSSNISSSASSQPSAASSVLNTPQCNLQFGAPNKDIIYAIANQQGLFVKNGISVCVTSYTDTNTAFQNLQSGAFHVISNQLDASIDRYVNTKVNITVIGGLDNNPSLALYSIQSIRSIQELRGKVIAVDQSTSGFIYAIEKILSLYGLPPGTYATIPIPSAPQRLQALVNGNFSGNAVHAALIPSPYSELQQVQNTAINTQIATLNSSASTNNTTTSNNTTQIDKLSNQVLNLLAFVNDYIPAYQGNVLTVQRNILQNQTVFALLRNFTLAQLQARQILQISANQGLVISAIQQEYNVSTAQASALYTSATDATGYLANPNLQIFTNQLVTPAYLRLQFGGFPGVSDISYIIPNSGPTSLVQYQVRDAALQLLYANNTFATPLNSSTRASTGVLVHYPMKRRLFTYPL